MTAFSAKHAPLRTATGSILKSPALNNKLTDFEQLLPSLNYLKRAVDESAFIHINIKMLQTAFTPVYWGGTLNLLRIGERCFPVLMLM
jgi:hypothetical protein